ncbi:MAG: phosphoribosylamine--glycine ligase [Flavobacteriaceae bacterium]|nr:phosphoribosylamine--glycine ligase [Flavobacteriaceae bacterium]MBL6684824.1 phosphoribosylamine--glycine ligase [Flavobacteriaceae bacterium]
MNILIIGSGAREHVFFHKLLESKTNVSLFSINPNAAISSISTALYFDFNFQNLKQAIIDNFINLILVGPEIPLIDGVYDFVKSDNEISDTIVIGPSKNGAMLEGSKDFAKEFMSKYSIPTAQSKSFTKESISEGINYLKNKKGPYVLKADGPAAGKGVVIVDKFYEAKIVLEDMLLNNSFGKSSETVVIEEFLSGIEMSCFVLFDGKNYLTLPYAKDYKRIGEGDVGLNTGGMGSISPVPFMDDEMYNKIEERIIKPTVAGLINEGIKYKGFIFIGLINVNGNPYVIEYNVRMGDPETQVVLPRIKNDFLEILLAIENQNLDQLELEIDTNHYTNVVLASKGYPESYNKGFIITGLEKINQSTVFHAGTLLKGNVLTNGGRVISVVSSSENFKEALKKSYESIDLIEFEGKTYRKDIGFDL